MPDIYHDFPVNGEAEMVFEAISTPEGLNAWWTKTCSGEPQLGEMYELGFGPGYNWKASVTKIVAGRDFELEISHAHKDWNGSRVGFGLEGKKGATTVHFYHKGWPEMNEHYRISCYCWAMYLRVLKRNLEFGELVPYEKRLDV